MIGALARKAIRKSLPLNSRLNRHVRALSHDRLSAIPDLNVGLLELKSEEHLTWLGKFLPDHGFSSPFFKKPIEFYATYQILAPSANDVFLDAAGGVYTYLHRIPARIRYMQDLQISPLLRTRLGDQIQYIESDAGAIPLPDASVDKISCHHSFEHFEGDSDSRFVREIQRLLRPGGRACILPLFLAEEYFEVTSRLTFAKKFDTASRRLIDLTATLPGGNGYARIYDPNALQRRILSQIDRAQYSVSVIEIRMDKGPVPDLELACNRNVAAVNSPFRALVIDR
jgi:SAM-dependent methyltransferase